MSELKIRKIPFEFEGVDFLWNPTNPAFSLFINRISFWVIGLERYFCKAMADADPLIKDASVRNEARLFKVQEMQHSLRHRHHVGALIVRYPGLQRALDKTIAYYDEIYDERDLKFHLAYAASLEGTFSPFFGTIIEQRDLLFAGGDPRVSSLCLWHFCEEIEHRSSAVLVYDDVVGDYLYKMRVFFEMQKHVRACMDMLTEEFKHEAPRLSDEVYEEIPLRRVSRGRRLQMHLGVLQSQMPWHDPATETPPAWTETWFDAYERGEDMREFYGRTEQSANAA